MEPEAILIGKSEIDSASIIQAGKKLLKKDLGINARKLDVKGFLTVLAAMEDETVTTLGVLENPGHLLSHLSYSFLVITDEPYETIRKTKLDIQISNTPKGLCLCVFTGTLHTWRIAILDCSNELTSYQTRLLFNKIHAILESEGLGKMLSGYKRPKLSDNTYKLTEDK